MSGRFQSLEVTPDGGSNDWNSIGMKTHQSLSSGRWPNRSGWFAILLLLGAIGLPGPSATAGEEKPREIPMASYNWWREARFGIFIHWNASALLQLGEGSWSRKNPTEQGHDVHRKGMNRMSKEPPAAITDGSYRKFSRQGGVPMEIYDNLFHIFNPKEFDAAKWAETFKDAGAGYVVFTTKHHDGFCMFDSKLTDYDIMNSPFRRDIAKELAVACQKRGIRVIWYYSRPDWFDPRHDVDNPEPYVDYLTGQVRELLTNYGEIAGIWWDSGQIEIPTRKLFDMMLGINPRLISNGRIQSSKHHVPGISFGTPEQELGAFNMASPWESCVTMQGEGWFWNGGKDIRSPGSCLRLLINCAIGDGNLLLDFGPDELGRIHPEVQRNFASMGQWLRQHGQSVYGTRGGPYMPNHWGGSTRKDRTVYLHITQTWFGRELQLPPLPRKIISSQLLTGGAVAVKQSDRGIVLEIDPKFHQPVDTVVALELDGDAMDILPIPGAQGHVDSLTQDAQVTASSSARFWGGMAPASVVGHAWESDKGHAAPKGLEDLRSKERGHIWRAWIAEDADAEPWIEVDLGKPDTFDVVRLREKFNRIRSFKLQIAGNGGWHTFHEGAELDVLSLRLAEPLTAQKVRVLITSHRNDRTDRFQGPGLQTFDLFLSSRQDGSE